MIQQNIHGKKVFVRFSQNWLLAKLKNFEEIFFTIVNSIELRVFLFDRLMNPLSNEGNGICIRPLILKKPKVF